MGESVAFDRAAEFYDRTRAVSDESMSQTVELLSSELAGRGRVLEVGVGTGLIALPLHERGIELVGVDVSSPMVAKLAEKAGGHPPFPVVLADATRMPIADGGLGGAYLRWVLHLIPDWPAVLTEIVRVVRPAGVFLANLGSYGGERREIQQRFEQITGVSTEPVGLTWAGFDLLDDEMTRLGARPRRLAPFHDRGEEPLEEFVQGIEENRYSWTWPISEDLRVRSAAELRAWADERFGPLGEPRPWQHETVWRAYDLA